MALKSSFNNHFFDSGGKTMILYLHTVFTYWVRKHSYI